MQPSLALGVFVCILLTACAEQFEPLPDSINSSDFSVPVPRAILKARIDPSDLVLIVTANGEAVPTTRSEEDNEWTGIMTVPNGQSLQLSIRWSIRDTEIATYDSVVSSVVSNLEVRISSDDYTILDNDMDDFTNIEELEAEPPTDPNDANSFPMLSDDVARLSDTNPGSLNLRADGSESALDTISFSNVGRAVLTFTVSSSQSWLKADPSGGSVPAGMFQTLNVTADCDAIDETRTGTLTIGGNGGSKSVPVSLECIPVEPPRVAILVGPIPESLSLSGQVSESAGGEFIIRNIGTASLSYTISSDASWLTVSPTNGNVEASQSQTLDVSAACNTIPETRNGTLTINSNGGDDKTISVSINCSSVPVGILNCTPESLSLSAQVLESENGTISCRNEGNARLDFTAFGIGESSEWITITPMSGRVGVNQNQTLEVAAMCDTIEETREGRLTIESAGSDDETVSVSIKCIALPPLGLVSAWPGDGNAIDTIDGNNGTLEDGTTFAPGVQGQAFSFDGVNDFVSIPFNQNYNFAPDGQFSIHAWINPGRISGAQAIVVRDVFEWDWGLWQSGNRFLTGHNNRNLTGQIQIQVGTWVHVAVTYDNGIHKLYVNGVLDTLTGQQSPITQSDNSLALGRRISIVGVHYQGLLDEVAIFDRTLTQPEIQAFATQ